MSVSRLLLEETVITLPGASELLKKGSLLAVASLDFYLSILIEVLDDFELKETLSCFSSTR